MKHLPLKLHWIIISAILVLALSSCVLPVPRDEGTESPDVVPTGETIIIPTAPSVDDAGTDAVDAGDTSEAPADETAVDEPVDDGGDAVADEPAEEAAPDAGGEAPAEEPPDTAVGTTHVVQSGETLGYIAELYDVSIADIAAANGISDLDSLDVGQELIIKSGAAAEAPPEADTEEESGEQVHIVQSGENLFRIGLRYGFTAEELAAYNNIPDVTRIDVGQIIKIPQK